MKAIDIAKDLGISKATVSLALNNKPGVSEKTKRLIFNYIKEKEENAEATQGDIVPNSELTLSPVPERKIIKSLAPVTEINALFSPSLGLLPDSHAIFQQVARQLGYTLETVYPDIRGSHEDVEEVIEDCNRDYVAGVIISAYQMTQEELKRFAGIRKPTVIYDNVFPENMYSSVTLNNASAVRTAVDYLVRNGIHDIGYLAMNANMYNYQQRRNAFLESMTAHNLPVSQDSITMLGSNVDYTYELFRTRWERIHHHEAYILESYHITVALLHALRDLKVQVPRDVSLVAIDEVPSYLTGDVAMTYLKVPHESRAMMAIQLLDTEIKLKEPFKTAVVSECRLVEGNSVRKRG